MDIEKCIKKATHNCKEWKGELVCHEGSPGW